MERKYPFLEEYEEEDLAMTFNLDKIESLSQLKNELLKYFKETKTHFENSHSQWGVNSLKIFKETTNNFVTIYAKVDEALSKELNESNSLIVDIRKLYDSVLK